MIWVAFAILYALVAILYVWVWQLSDCHKQPSRRIYKDDVLSQSVKPAPTYVSEKWSVDLNPRKKRTYRGKKRPVRKTKKERE